MPQYRVGYLLTYRVAAHGDTDAARKVMDTLTARFPSATFDPRTSNQSASQSVSGETTYDVQVVATGVVTATDIADSLTKVTVPATGLVASVTIGSVDTRGQGLF